MALSGRSPRRPSPRPRGPEVAILAVALALVGLIAYLAWPPKPRPPQSPNSTVQTVVFFGNSITSGHGLPVEVAFPHRLGAALGIPVRNAGISGDTTDGGLARLDADVLALRPRLVVVELGVNDVFGQHPRVRTIENLRTITRRIRARGAQVVLIHIRLPRLTGDGYREDLRDIARGEGARLVEDFLDGIVPDLTTDGLHPNEEGHARLATRLEPILRDLLAR